MGFLDSIFGKKEEEKKELDFSDIFGWINERKKKTSEDKKKNADPLLKEIKKNTSKIEKHISELDKKPIPAKLDKKLLKIIKTNKPGYVKGMRKVIDELKSLDGIEGLEEKSKQLKETLDSLGTLSFGEGRYLPAVYLNEIKRIQEPSKAILDLHEEFKGLLEEKDENVIDIYTRYDEYSSLEESLQSHKALLEDNEKTNKDSKNKLKDKKEQVDKLSKEAQSKGNLKARQDYENSKKSVKQLEDKIFSSFSKLSRGLKKYSRVSLNHEKLIMSFLNDPVATYDKTDEEKVQSLLSDFVGSLESSQIDLKDSDKMLEKAKEVKKILGNGFKKSIENARDERDDAKTKLDSIDAFESEKRAKEDLTILEQRLNSSQEAILKVKEDIHRIESEMISKKESFVKPFEALDIELKIQ